MTFKPIIGLAAIYLFIVYSFSACSTGSKSTMQEIINNQRILLPADSIIQKQKKGIDFIASGNEPSNWSLAIDFDRIVNFSAADGNTLNILPSFARKEITAEIEKYNTVTDLGPVEIRIFNAACNSTGNPGEFNRKVEVTISNKTYHGCGKYLFNHQLNDIWELESINNEKQVASAFSKGIPRLEFNLLLNKMNGSDGCNAVNSDFEIKGNRIQFSTFSGTRMSCKNNQAAKIFSELLSSKTVDYYLENGKLVLYLEDDSKISFKRKSL